MKPAEIRAMDDEKLHQQVADLLAEWRSLPRKRVTLLPKLRVQFAEFLQHSSLKRLGMLYQSTCVGFGYGLCGGYFLEPLRCIQNPVTGHNLRNSSLPTGSGIFT